MPTGADVPSIFDVVINAQGYLVADTEQFQATMGSAPVFSPVASYTRGSDSNTQDEWFQTLMIDDFRGGEGQRRFSVPMEDSKHKFAYGGNLDIENDHKLLVSPNSGNSTAAAGVIGMCPRGFAYDFQKVAFITSGGIAYEMNQAGTITSIGAHGAGTVAAGGFSNMCEDSYNIYVAGATSIRKWNGATWSTFATVVLDSIAYYEGNIYGMRSSNGDLLRFDRATGEVTLITKWLRGDGSAANAGSGTLVPTPDGLFCVMQYGESSQELWLYDGNPQLTVKRVLTFPHNVQFTTGTHALGSLYLAGVDIRDSTISKRGVVYRVEGGQARRIWQEEDWNSNSYPSVVSWRNGILISASFGFAGLIFYNPETDAKNVVSYNAASGGSIIAASLDFVASAFSTGTTIVRWPTTTFAPIGYYDSSLIDFGSPLPKRFHSVEVEWENDSGNGSSIDIYYALDKNENTGMTLLRTGAVSNTAYALSQVGRSLCVRLVINTNQTGGTGTPVVKRITVRALPFQALQRNETYVLNLSGRDGTRPLTLRNGSLHAKDGLDMANDLRTAASSNSPVSVTDEFGTFTGYIDTSQLEFRRIRTQEYVAIVPIREVV